MKLRVLTSESRLRNCTETVAGDFTDDDDGAISVGTELVMDRI